MAPPTEVTEEVLSRFYIEEDPQITEQTRSILRNTVVSPRMISLLVFAMWYRDKAWTKYKYPCIGLYNFLDFGISTSPKYFEVLNRIKEKDAKLLDLGCCMGQDIRKLIFDGAPAVNITGYELEPEFIELGFELFKDRERLAAKNTFITGDFFGPELATSLGSQSFDIIHASSFFQLFSRSAQAEALSRALKLLKPILGSLLFGRQTGARRPETVRYKSSRSDEMFRHNVDSFKELIEEVGRENGIELSVEVEAYTKLNQKELENWLMLNYCVVLL